MKRALLLTSFVAAGIAAHAQWTACVGSTSALSVIDFYHTGTKLLLCSPYTDPVRASTDDGANFSAATTGPSSYGAYSNIIGNGTTLYTVGRDTYESTDDGSTWTKKGSMYPGVKPNDAVYYHGAIYAATNAGVQRSTDGGTTYTTASSGLVNNNVNDILVHGDALYITTLSTGVYKSTDDGATWTSIKSDLPGGSLGNRITALGTTLFYSEYGSGLYMSTNDGGSWTKVTAAPSSAIVSLLPVSGKLVVGCAAGKVFYTSDNGASFTNIDLPSSAAICQKLFYHNGYLLAGTDAQGAFRMSTTWGGTSSTPHELLSARFNVSPNPGNGVFDVSLTGNATSIEVLNTLGQVIYQANVSGANARFDISDQPAGIYLVRVSSGLSSATTRLVKR